MELMDKARDKQEELGGDRDSRFKVYSELEMINGLKRVELKFQELLEKRSVFSFFKLKDLRVRENEQKAERRELTRILTKDKKREEKKRKAEIGQRLIDFKKNLVVAKNIRMVERSRKPVLKTEKTTVERVPPEIEEMRRYLGIVPGDWNITAPVDKKEEEKTEAGGK